MKGIYALFMMLDDADIEVGALGRIPFENGEYCYIGSAMNGLEQRIRRHMSPNKKIHWHIDRLTVQAVSIEAYISLTGEECGLRRTAESCGMTPVVKGFGCSDCRCDTHLLLSDPVSKRRFLEETGLRPFASLPDIDASGAL